MHMPKTWFITGATRGLGVDIAEAALKAGDRVVATGRSKAAVTTALGADSDKVLALELDVSKEAQAKPAVDAAVKRFGGIDVLVNNAGYGSLGFFEEYSFKDVETQYATNVFGLMHVTRAVLPVMRKARSGRIFNISSFAGVRGTAFSSLYCSSKFAVEGFSEALAKEVEPFGLFVTIIEPGPFRTDFLKPESIRYGGTAGNIADYDQKRAEISAYFAGRNGSQPGDPVKLAEAMVKLAGEAKPPMRFLAGKFATEGAEGEYKAMVEELQKWKAASMALDYES
jgi:NAD(P)-dependent dehydrogenase (short-subunit alcohol dehydrogenase family)